jgi:hypothetical protein
VSLRLDSLQRSYQEKHEGRYREALRSLRDTSSVFPPIGHELYTCAGAHTRPRKWYGLAPPYSHKMEVGEFRPLPQRPSWEWMFFVAFILTSGVCCLLCPWGEDNGTSRKNLASDVFWCLCLSHTLYSYCHFIFYLCINWLIFDTGSCCIAQAGLELYPPASASCVLGLQVCTSVPGSLLLSKMNSKL